MNNILITIPVVSCEIVKRPSAKCKTPYVADIIIDNSESLAHSPSLGCCGLAEKGCHVLVSSLPVTKKTQVCSYRIELAIDNNTCIGINPKLAEIVAEKALVNNLISCLTNVTSYKREVKILNSRFDFYGIDSEDIPFIMEIKSVPLANNNVAYFPDGYRKSKKDVISPRALKHVQELQQMKTDSTTPIRCILCFVIQRDDATSFEISPNDAVYKGAVRAAQASGVEIITIQTSWNSDGQCEFLSDKLPIIL